MPKEQPLFVSTNSTQSVDIDLRNPVDDRLRKDSFQKTRYVLCAVVMIMLQVSIATLLGLIVALVVKEVDYAHEILADMRIVLSDVEELLPQTRRMFDNVTAIHEDISLVRRDVAVNLEMLLRFCRIEQYRDYCLMPVPEDYAYNVTHVKPMGYDN